MLDVYWAFLNALENAERKKNEKHLVFNDLKICVRQSYSINDNVSTIVAYKQAGVWCKLPLMNPC